ncbi:MAG: HAD family hydrolase, partial [Candidatus Brocadiae bacterium]|nr:HAD family hydrolase [Candidatus Brocadiia bacterium]
LRDGAKEVLQELGRRGFKVALLTRNSAQSVRIVLKRFGLRFDCWVSREHAEPKPSPVPVLRIADELALAPEELLVVGDYVFDVQAGHAAGARAAFLKTDIGVEPPPETDVVLSGLPELLDLLTEAPG